MTEQNFYLSMNPDCLFCKIAAKMIPAKIVYEDDRAVAFLDIMPRAPGHVMVIPKYHAASLAMLPDEEVEPLFKAVKETAKLLMEALRPDGLTFGINQGKASGQDVDHLHVHIMPRWHDDGGGSVQSVVHVTSQESLDAIQKKILSKEG
jgi:histidine triad (HIT) family protein